MEIIESTNVDLIEPFPSTEAKRVYGWMHTYKSIVETDQSPKTPEDFANFLNSLLPNIRSFGVIDKDNRLGMNHEVPLIGMIAFEPETLWNGYIHIASTRKAWGSGLFEEGVVRSITHLFESMPDLLRITARTLSKNYPARKMAERLNFKLECVMEDMATQHNSPIALAQYSMTRRRWN